LLAASSVKSGDAAHRSDRNFDEYGLINWGDEQARLDNFAIQIQNETDSIGYIFVFDGTDVCEGEAKARAIRARDYVVNYRGVPWNRVMWRYDGFAGDFQIALQPAARSLKIPDPWKGPFQHIPPINHITEKCDLRLKKIKNSKPGQAN
jgi:hypothetical protein